MKLEVTVVKTPAGNTGRLVGALERLGARPIVRTPSRLAARSGPLVLPGVSSFTTLTSALAPARSKLQRAAADGVPILGICAGMQALFDSSSEGPGEGIGLLPGRIVQIRSARRPHLGWSAVRSVRPTPLSKGVDGNSYAYFAHSFRAPSRLPATVCVTTYDRETFPSAVGMDNVWGLQFHPELSGEFGRRILSNFLAYAREVGP